jgi:hypothetical protein
MEEAYLEVAAIGGEDRVGQVVACAYRSLWSCQFGPCSSAPAAETYHGGGWVCGGKRAMERKCERAAGGWIEIWIGRFGGSQSSAVVLMQAVELRVGAPAHANLAKHLSASVLRHSLTVHIIDHRPVPRPSQLRVTASPTAYACAYAHAHCIWREEHLRRTGQNKTHTHRSVAPFAALVVSVPTRVVLAHGPVRPPPQRSSRVPHCGPKGAPPAHV